MANYSENEKKTLRDTLERLIKSSGISGNKYAERLKVSNGTITNILNYWNVDGKVGDQTWTILEKHISQVGKCDGVATENYKRVFAACESAYFNKSAEPIIGNGGFGKTYALNKFKIAFERETAGKTKVHYLDASMSPKPKRLISALMEELGCWKAGKMATQLLEIKKHFNENDCLVIIDEVSALESKDVTVLKDILTAARGVVGVVLSGTPYFLENVLRGKAANRHLFSELEDRFFSIPTILTAPTDNEAEAIFKLHNLSAEQIDIVMGRLKNEAAKRFCWTNKPTYRGIVNCIQMIKDLERDPIFKFDGVMAI